jgi:hypothetical protein
VALLQWEVERIRFELGYNVLTVGAEPYISYVAVFDDVIRAFLQAGAVTTSSTTVTAVAPPTPPQPVALTLASSAGFAAGDRIWLDVDARQEAATIESLVGSVATVLLRLDHAGTYPVTQEGGEAIVREKLNELRQVQARILRAAGSAGISRADEVSFFPSNSHRGGSAQLDGLYRMREDYRRELAEALGVQYLRPFRRGVGSTGAVLY